METAEKIYLKTGEARRMAEAKGYQVIIAYNEESHIYAQGGPLVGYVREDLYNDLLKRYIQATHHE